MSFTVIRWGDADKGVSQGTFEELIERYTPVWFGSCRVGCTTGAYRPCRKRGCGPESLPCWGGEQNITVRLDLKHGFSNGFIHPRTGLLAYYNGGWHYRKVEA